VIRNQTCIEIKKGEKTYCFSCDMSAPLGEVYDVLLEMRNYVVQLLNDIEKQSKNNPEQENVDKS